MDRKTAALISTRMMKDMPKIQSHWTEGLLGMGKVYINHEVSQKYTNVFKSFPLCPFVSFVVDDFYK